MAAPAAAPAVPSHIPPALSPSLTLKPHQHTAVAFAWRALFEEDDAFAILADEQGTGKTIVALQLMIRILAASRPGAVLLLSGRVIQDEVWRKHLHAYAPSVHVHAVSDDKPGERVEKLRRAVRRRHQVVLCTTHMARDMHADGAWAAATAAAAAVIVDECQCMNNAASQMWRTVAAMRATPTLLMSGTPFHNQPVPQLRALCAAAAAPGTALAAADIPLSEFLARWMERHGRVLLQRTTADLAVADASMRLPPLRKRDHACDFSEKQAREFHAGVRRMWRAFRAMQAARARAPDAAQASVTRFWAALTTLQVITSHPLISDVSAGEMDAYAAARQASKHMSIKLHLAVKLVCRQCVRDNKKVVVASHFVQFLEILACRLEALGISFVSFTGAVRGPVRSANLERWKDPASGVRVLLLSRAGVAGISLPADYALDVDSAAELNPCVAAQLHKRFHRYGIDKHTTLVRLVIPGTIDGIQAYRDGKEWESGALTGQKKRKRGADAAPPAAQPLGRRPRLAYLVRDLWRRTAWHRRFEEEARAEKLARAQRRPAARAGV